MSFLGIGLPEIALILIIAVIVVGPQRLPELAIQIARAIRYLRGYATDATAQIRAELDELTKEYDQVRKELHEFRQAIGKEAASVGKEIDRTLRESRPVIEPSAESPPEARQPEGPTAP